MKEKYLFICLEDLFPTGTVNSDILLKSFQFLEKKKAKHIHFAPVIRPDGLCDDPLFGYYERGGPYRVTAQGFWNRDELIKLLLPGENPWKFEIMGSYRSSYSDGYYTVTKSLFPFIRVVDKGRISWEAYRYCQKHGVILDTSRRAVFGFKEKIIGDVYTLLFHFVLKIPWRWRVNLIEKIRRIVVSY